MLVLTMDQQLEASLASKFEALVEANARICGVNDGLSCLEEMHRLFAGKIRARSGRKGQEDGRLSLAVLYEELALDLMEQARALVTKLICDQVTTENMRKLRDLFVRATTRDFLPSRHKVPPFTYFEVRHVKRALELSQLVSATGKAAGIDEMKAFRGKVIAKQSELTEKIEKLRALHDNSIVMAKNPPISVVGTSLQMSEGVKTHQTLQASLQETFAKLSPHIEHTRECQTELHELITRLDSLSTTFPNVVDDMSKTNEALLGTSGTLAQLRLLQKAVHKFKLADASGIEEEWQSKESGSIESSDELSNLHNYFCQSCSKLEKQIHELSLTRSSHDGNTVSRHLATSFEKWCCDDCDRHSRYFASTAQVMITVTNHVKTLNEAIAGLISLWTRLGDSSERASDSAALEWCEAVIAALSAEVATKKTELAAIQAKVRGCQHKKTKCIARCGHTLCDSCRESCGERCPTCSEEFSSADVVDIQW